MAKAACVIGSSGGIGLAIARIAAAVSFLAGDGAAFVTGAILPVNGGLRMD